MSFLKLNDLSSSRINSNRLLHEAEALNSKVNQYRKTLSFGFSTTKNDSLSNSLRRQGLTSNPKREYSTLNNISQAFSPIAVVPSTERLAMTQSDPNPSTRIKHLYYDNHVKGLYSNFKSALAKIEEKFSSNKAQASSVRQILNDELFYQREQQIESLIDEIGELKGQLSQSQSNSNDIYQRQIESLKQNYEQELHKEAKESKYIIDKYQQELALVKANNDQCKNEIDQLLKTIKEIEKEYQKTNNQLKDCTNQYESLKRNNENIKEELYDSSMKLKLYEDDNNALRELLDQHQHEKDSQNNLMQSYEKQQQTKYDSFDIAIVNLKESNRKLEDEFKCERGKLILSKQSYNKLYEEMQEKVKLLSTEWEKKHKDEQRDYERLIAEIDSKNKERVEEIINEKDGIIQERNKEIIKCKQSIEILQALQKDSIRINEHEARVNEEIDILKQQHDSEKVFIEEENKIKMGNLEKEKKSECDKALDALNAKINQLNGSIDQLNDQLSKEKNLNEKQSKEINDLNSTIESKLRDVTQLNSTLQLKQNELNDINTDMQNKFKAITSLTEQNGLLKEQIAERDNEIETTNKVLEDKSMQITELESDKAKERAVNINLKNEIQDLVLSIRDLESKVKSGSESYSVLYNHLTETILIRDKLIESLSQIKNELALMKKHNVQAIQKAKNEIWAIVDGLNLKLKHYDTNKWNQMKDLEAQFEKHYTELYKQNEKLQHDNKTLIALHQKDEEKINEIISQLNKKENETEHLSSSLAKANKEIDAMKANVKESNNKMQSAAESLKGKANRMRKQYQDAMNDIRAFVDNLYKTHRKEVAQAANTQSTSLQNVIKALKNESMIQSDSMQKLKTLNQALTIDVENKGEELSNTKKEYDKLINMKDKKIKNLQNIISQSFSTYSSGINSLMTSQKLNDDVRNLIRKAKEDELFNDGNR